jgi:holo-[acyl-carrier-protein] synthase
MKIGTDIVKISRIEDCIKNEHFLHNVFTKNEIEYCKNAESFAGLFAGKEAYLKAIESGIDRRLDTLEILHKDNGKPYFNSIENCDLSISHDGEYAIATVILW